MGEERAVRIVKTSMVVPEVETARHGLWLSNIDLMAWPEYTTNFSVYRSNGDADFFSREKLKASLSKALVPFYPLAGRLVTGQDGRVEVCCNGEGVVFLEAESDSTIAEFGDFVPSPEIRQMLVPPAPSGDPQCVLFLVQVTSFRCGGVSLGIATHHAVVDGLAALHFIGTWADISRGADKLLPPFLDRGLLRARSPPKVLVELPIYLPQELPPAEAKPSSTAVLHLSEVQLAALKSIRGVRLGTFKAVVAHAWRCLCKVRGLADDEESRLLMMVDARTRLDPPLPKGFLGNAAFQAAVTARVGDVKSDPLERTANRIHEATLGLGDEHVRSLVDFLELQGDLRKLARLSRRLTATDLCAVNWLGLPVYDADFGWGRPVLMRQACLLHSGIVYVMHSPGKDGGVSVILSLEPEHMLAFQKAFFHGWSSTVGTKCDEE